MVQVCHVLHQKWNVDPHPIHRSVFFQKEKWQPRTFWPSFVCEVQEMFHVLPLRIRILSLMLITVSIAFIYMFYTMLSFNPLYEYTLCSKKGDAKIQITITMAHLIRIIYPLSSFNYCLSDTSIANFNKIHHIFSEQQLFKKWNSKTEFSNMENTD